jgi:drug/metabolite transporter (DMT)-like permease
VNEGNSGGCSRFAPYAWMLCGCFSFAWMSEFAHQLGRLDCDWRIVALARSLLAFLFATTLALACGARLAFWKPGILWLRSCAGSLSLLCTFFALTRLRTSEVLTLTNTFPIWVALLSWPLLRVRPGLPVWAAAVCGVLGIVLIQRPSFEGVPGARVAVPLALVAAMTSALAMLGLHRLKELHPWAIVVHFSGVATLFVLGAWLFGPRPAVEQALDAEHVRLLVGVGATATLGQLCLTQAFTRGQPARVSVVGLTQIVFAMGLELHFGESPFADPARLAGIGLVVAPTAWMMMGKAGE